jgi:hypothetical protein
MRRSAPSAKAMAATKHEVRDCTTESSQSQPLLNHFIGLRMRQEWYKLLVLYYLERQNHSGVESSASQLVLYVYRPCIYTDTV